LRPEGAASFAGLFCGPFGPPPTEINLSLTISVLIPLTIGASAAARVGNRAVAARRKTTRRLFGSPMVVCFGGFRGDADGCAGVCLGCEKRPLKAPLLRAGHRRICRRFAHRLISRRGHRTDPAAKSRKSRQSRQRFVAAVVAGQSGEAAAVSAARATSLVSGGGAASDQHIRADAHRRDADLRQPQRFRRRRYRLRFAEHPAQ